MPKNDQTEFPVTVDEFARDIAKPETRRAFVGLMKREGNTGPKMRAFWTRMLGLFESQPVDTAWKEWIDEGGK